MLQNTNDSHEEIKRLLEENVALAKENNKLLKKIHRAGVVGLLVRLVWLALLVGIPFILYFYLLDPYLEFIREIYHQLPEGHLFRVFFEAAL